MIIFVSIRSVVICPFLFHFSNLRLLFVLFCIFVSLDTGWLISLFFFKSQLLVLLILYVGFIYFWFNIYYFLPFACFEFCLSILKNLPFLSLHNWHRVIIFIFPRLQLFTINLHIINIFTNRIS